MRRLMNYLRGMAVVRLTGLFPERLINLCAQEGIEFWAMEWLDEHTVRFTTRRYTLLASPAAKDGKITFATKQMGTMVLTTGTI